MKTAQEVFTEVLEELGFDGYKPKDLTNSDYWTATTLAMERFSNQFINLDSKVYNALNNEVSFKSKIYQVLFEDGASSQEKIYELKQLFLSQE